MDNMKTLYIRINSKINDKFVEKFYSIIDKYKDVDTVYLIINSDGGIITHALSIANYIQSSSIKFVGYNLYMVASAALQIYFACNQKGSAPNGLFIPHHVDHKFNNEILDVYAIKNILENMELNENLLYGELSKLLNRDFHEEFKTKRCVYISAKELYDRKIIDNIEYLTIPSFAVVESIDSFDNQNNVSKMNCLC